MIFIFKTRSAKTAGNRLKLIKAQGNVQHGLNRALPVTQVIKFSIKSASNFSQLIFGVKTSNQSNRNLMAIVFLKRNLPKMVNMTALKYVNQAKLKIIFANVFQ